MTKLTTTQSPGADGPNGPHVFSFAPNGDGFLLNGKPFQIRSGELHPARIPVEYWLHRIQMAKAMGMNTIALYVMWNYHEMREGAFDFQSDNRDIEGFIRLCQAENMWVLFRPGPYVCAEWDLGGIPSYLLKHPDIRLRTDYASDARYMRAVERYIDELVPRVRPLMAENGGPILMIQIENEFGSFDSNPAYLEELRQLWIRGGIHGPFYTEDGLVQLQQNLSYVADGAIALSNGNAAQIDAVRKVFPSVPAMAGEVYPGWLTHWGDSVFQGTSVDLSATLDELMRKNQSFNLYVIHGGTSFGFYAGANVDVDSDEYQPDITSYDYAAPISEQGVATARYMAYRSIIARYLSTPLPDVPAPIATIPAMDSNGVRRLMPRRYASLWDNLPAALPLADTMQPQPFEMYGQAFGFVLYRKKLARYAGGALDIGDVHDYATVFVGDQYAGAVSRARVQEDLASPRKIMRRRPVALPDASSRQQEAAVLEILVEGMGRVNYGHSMIDRKGIVDPVVIHDASGASEIPDGWEVVLLPMDASFIESLRPVCSRPNKPGMFFVATLPIDAVGDVYLDMSEWTKGIVWVNGRNLGRYWHIGPQMRLYCPAPWLKPGDNTVLIFDLHQTEAKPVSLASSLS
ncbi:beta-galactosidase [Paraburkholderia sp. Tr-20389]|uniref:beta-galactosidase n=1 Tax=Paraburkholderia sp. Tr-20389 TaxID=2703903 RepID=UPI001982392F|nr:beta-galactosidase [Paraburkholderia sp. Tr-20389]MBN3753085.1 beta-galactosidase [Paraburkholderia sp. Tr-20389]